MLVFDIALGIAAVLALRRVAKKHFHITHTEKN